jgi:hypothetical protein
MSGTRWYSWLRHYVTRRKVEGSIPEWVETFHWLNPSGQRVELASNRNEYQEQEYLLRDKGGRCVGLTSLPPLCADCLESLGTSIS